MPKSSAVLIQEMLERFADKHSAKFPDDARVSQRRVSCWLSDGSNPNLLARWTNEKHHAEHSEWRIPLFRVQQLCDVLEATDEERDLLMATRVEEAIAYDKCRDANAVVDWLLPVLTEALSRPVLDAQERQVLAAFRAARSKSTVGELLPPQSELDSELQELLGLWIGKTVNAYVDQELAENALDEASTSQAGDEALRKLKARTQELLKKQRPGPKTPGQREMHRTIEAGAALKRLMRNRRKAQETFASDSTDVSGT